jgi:hypothetical protein
MDRQQVGLKLTMDALGFERLFALKDFKDRLILQKAVYLTQAAGLQLGYHFNWYLRGPYSPGLTKDAFAMANELAQKQDDAKDWNLDAESVQRLTRIKPLFEKTPEPDLPKRLELLASILFLLKEKRATSTEPAKLDEVLKRNGKDFSWEEIRQGLKELDEYGLWPGPAA